MVVLYDQSILYRLFHREVLQLPIDPPKLQNFFTLNDLQYMVYKLLTIHFTESMYHSYIQGATDILKLYRYPLKNISYFPSALFAPITICCDGCMYNSYGMI